MSKGDLKSVRIIYQGCKLEVTYFEEPTNAIGSPLMPIVPFKNVVDVYYKDINLTKILTVEKEIIQELINS